jgi:flagellar basal body-associated protein FliL
MKPGVDKMELKVENRKKSSLLLIIAVIVVSILVVWVIMLFDRMDNPGNTQRSTNKQIKQTLTDNQSYNVYDLLRYERNYT